jgi:RHS repeat-associated protein
MWIDENGARLFTFEYGQAGPDYQLKLVTARTGKAIKFNWSQAWHRGRVVSITDSSLGTWRYGYDAQGNLERVISPSAVNSVPERTFHYEDLRDPQRLTGTSIDGVRRLRVEYDIQGRVVKSGFSNGQEFEEFSYGRQPLHTTVTNQSGQVIRYEFELHNEFKRLTRTVRLATNSVEAAEQSQSFGEAGLPERLRDWNGNQTEIKYSTYGRVEEITFAAGTSIARSTRLEWNGDQLERTTQFDSGGRPFHERLFRYGGGLATSMPIEESETDLITNKKRTVEYEYDFHPNAMLASRKTKRLLPTGAVESVESYDVLGNLVARTNALGQVTSFKYLWKPGLPDLVKDANGETAVDYDGFGRIVQLHDSGYRRTTKVQYNGDGSVKTLRDPIRGLIRYKYSDAGKLTHIIDSDGTEIIMSGDASEWAQGIRFTRSPRYGSGPTNSLMDLERIGDFVKKVELDSLGRIWKEYDSSGPTRTYSYDGNGNLRQYTEADGRVWRFEFNGHNQKTAAITPTNSRTTTEYDTRGFLKAVIDANNIRTSFEYNSFGELEVEDHPDAGKSTLEYDLAGRLSSHLQADGTLVQYQWDALDRLTSRSAGGLRHSFVYDEGRYGTGRLTSYSDESGSTRLRYNMHGQVADQVTTVLSLFGGEFNTVWTYNAFGALSGVRYPDGTRIWFDLDEQGRVSAIRSNLVASPLLIRSVVRQPASDIKLGWLNGNGIADVQLRDQDGRIESSSTTGLFRRSYRFVSQSDRIERIDEAVSGTSRAFRYDPLNRLESENGNSVFDKFELDAVGNRTYHSGTTGSTAYSYYSSTNRLRALSGALNRTFEYDALGNVTSNGSHRFEYDAFGRLTSAVRTGIGAAMRYNALGHRVRKDDKIFIYGPDGKLLWERGAQPSSYVWLDGDVVGLIRNKRYFSVHADHVGRPQALTDRLGSIAWLANHSAFSREVKVDKVGGFHLGFPGQYWDEDIQLWYNWHRFYDASTGRYLAVDPLQNRETSPYQYSNGDPVSLVDPTGLAPEGAIRFTSMIQKEFPPNPNLTNRSDGLPQGFGCGDARTDIVVMDLFPKACEAHDACYAAQCGRKFCDRQFLDDMRKERPDKYISSRFFYLSVRAFGQAAYENARRPK